MTTLLPAASPPLSFRDHSVNAVLWHVHRAGVVPRSELSRAVGLNRSSIARVITELSDRGLVETAGTYRPGTRGRPSLLVQASPSGPVALAAEIRAASIVVAAGTLGGHLLSSEEIAHPMASTGAIPAVERVAELLNAMRRRYRRQGVVGSVLVVPGRLNRSAVEAPALGWRDVPAQDLVASMRNGDLPVEVMAAVDAAAVGEHLRGAGTGLTNIVAVASAPTFAAGMVLDGQLFRGASGGAGQIAHLTVNVGGARCDCGRRGCLEAEVDAETVARLAAAVDRMATAGREDRRTARNLRRLGQLVGAALEQLTSILNPQAVILGGPVGAALPRLADGIADAYESAHSNAPRVLAAALRDDSAVIGGIETGLQRLFAASDAAAEPAVAAWSQRQREAG